MFFFLVAASNALSHLWFSFTTSLARWSRRFLYVLYALWYVLLIVLCCLLSVGNCPHSGILPSLSIIVILGADERSSLGHSGG